MKYVARNANHMAKSRWEASTIPKSSNNTEISRPAADGTRESVSVLSSNPVESVASVDYANEPRPESSNRPSVPRERKN